RRRICVFGLRHAEPPDRRTTTLPARALTEQRGERATENEKRDEEGNRQAEADGHPEKDRATEVAPADITSTKPPDKMHDQTNNRQAQYQNGNKPLAGGQ